MLFPAEKRMSISTKPKLIKTLISNRKWVWLSKTILNRYFSETQPSRKRFFTILFTWINQIITGALSAYLLNSRQILAHISDVYLKFMCIWDWNMKYTQILRSKPKHNWLNFFWQWHSIHKMFNIILKNLKIQKISD